MQARGDEPHERSIQKPSAGAAREMPGKIDRRRQRRELVKTTLQSVRSAARLGRQKSFKVLP